MSLFKILILILTLETSSAELAPSADSPISSQPSSINDDNIGSEIEDLRHTLLAIKINKYGSKNTLLTLRKVEKITSDQNQNSILSSLDLLPILFDENPPSNPLLAESLSQRIANGLSVGGAGISVDVGAFLQSVSPMDRAMTTQEKLETIEIAKKLIQRAESNADPSQAKLINDILQTYLNTEYKLDPKKDLDFIEIGNLSKHFGRIETALVNIYDSNNTNTKVIEEAIKHVSDKISKLNSQMLNQLGQQKNLINTGFLDLSVNTERIERKIDSIRHRLIKKDYRDEILKTKDPNVIQNNIDILSQCKTDNSISELCELKTEDLNSLIDYSVTAKSELEFNLLIQSAKNVTSGLNNLGVLFNNEDLIKVANVIDKVTFTIESIDKMNSLLNSALKSGGLVAMGDMTSMFNIATSLVGAFGSSGPSSDEIIMMQLRKILEEIQKLREEIQKGFQDLNKKIDDLGVSINSQFLTLNSNILIIDNKLDNLARRLDAEFSSKDNYVELLNKHIIITQTNSLITYTNIVATSADPKEVNSALLKLISEYKSNLSSEFQFDWLDDFSANDDSIIDKITLLISKTSKDSTKIYNWLSTFSRLSEYSKIKFKNTNCNNISGELLVKFNVYTKPLSEALSLNYGNPTLSGVSESNKFINFINTTLLEDTYFDQIEDIHNQYTKSVENINLCFNNFYLADNGSISLIEYLINNVELNINQYLDEMLLMFKDNNISTAFTNAIQTSPINIFGPLINEFHNLEPQKITNLKINHSFDFISQESSPTTEVMIEKIFPEISNCYDPTKRIKTPTPLLIKTFPKTETWQSIYLGLNTLQICYLNSEKIEHANWIPNKNVFELRFTVTNNDVKNILSRNVPFSFWQVYRLPLPLNSNDFPGEWISQTEMFPEDNDPEPIKLYPRTVHYFKPKFELIFNNYIKNGKILDYNSHCYNHDNFINLCYPSDFKQKSNYYRNDNSCFMQTNCPKLPIAFTDNFIKIKSEEEVLVFNKLNVKAENIRSFIDITTSEITSCASGILLKNQSCIFGRTLEGITPLESIIVPSEKLNKLSDDLEKTKQLIRFLKDSLLKKKVSAKSEDLDIFYEDLDTLMLSTDDLIEMMLFEAGNTYDILTPITKLRIDLQMAFDELKPRISNLVEINLDEVTKTPEYFNLETQILNTK